MRLSKIFLLSALIVPLVLSACQKILFEQGGVSEAGGLVFWCDEPDTKAASTKPGENDWNENLIKSIDCWFYPIDCSNADAVFHQRFSLASSGVAGVQGEYQSSVNFTLSEISALFGNKTKCEVYAIANIDSSLLPGSLSGTSIQNLKSIVLSSTFGSAKNANHKQDAFVMEGYNTITLASMSQTVVASGEVQLFRLAAKLSLLLDVPDTIHVRVKYKDDQNVIYEADEIWEPMTNLVDGKAQVESYLEYGYSETHVGVRTDPAYTVNTDTADQNKYFSYSKNRMQYDSSKKVMENEVSYMYSDPSYSYPVSWTLGATTESFFKLVMPWKRQNKILVYKNGVEATPEEIAYNVAQKQFYYKIIFPQNELLANKWYKFKLHVGILGSETDDAKVGLSCTYSVADWQNVSHVLEEAEVGNARYLSLTQSFTIYNERTLDIPFKTSDDCEIVDASWKQRYFGTATSGYVTIDGVKYKQGAATGWLSFPENKPNTIHLEHTLNNVQGATMDTAPYIITFTVRHKDDHTHAKQVVIYQYPAMYIDNKEGGDVFVDGYFARVNNATLPNASTLSGTYKYSRNYGNNPYNNTVMSPYCSVTRGSNNLTLTDLTRITVTVFSGAGSKFNSSDGEKDYVIGDPRVPSGWSSGDLVGYLINNNNNNNSEAWGEKAGKILVGTTRENIIAPSFYVASAWSAINNNELLNFETAKKRCATYQEAGYPAGRWRIPTEAEVNFVQSLQEYKFIPTLFNEQYPYWTSKGTSYKGSNGVYNANSNQTDPGLRCVYDVWYWGEEPMSANTYHPNPE